MKHVTSASGLLDAPSEQGQDFFTGIPDNPLKQFIGELHRLPAEQHVPATWEAETVGVAAGAYLAGRR
jgi:sulfopyruvate decarboxylase TPP-binding subunit